METNTCSFSKPQYTRVTNQNGTMEARYTFTVTPSNPLVVSYHKPASIQLQLQEAVATNNTYVTNILTMFLTSCSHYFAKPYTVEGIQRILQHAMSTLPEQPTDDDYDILFLPTGITIMQGKFILDWSATYQKIRITIPDLDQPSQEALKESTDELIQVDDLEEDLRQMEEPNERDSSRHYEKRKVKEARLRARLAQYKAERAMSKYLEKYGADISDSDWTGSSSDDDDDDDDESN
jgi:hypothetical protein